MQVVCFGPFILYGAFLIFAGKNNADPFLTLMVFAVFVTGAIGLGAIALVRRRMVKTEHLKPWLDSLRQRHQALTGDQNVIVVPLVDVTGGSSAWDADR